MELTRLRGRKVIDDRRIAVGRVADVVVRVDREYPEVIGLLVATRGGGSAWVPWRDIVELEEEELAIRSPPGAAGTVPVGVHLVRDVLDAQVYDIHGRRFARVGDVRLARRGDDLIVVGLELGLRAVLRRLRLGWIAGGRDESPVDWRAVRIAPGRGHALRMLTVAAPRLAPSDMAELLAHVPVDRGADLLGELPAREAADVLSHSRPRVGARLVGALRPARAGRILGAMPADDATATLRHLPPQELDRLLAHVATERAEELRRLLAHPVKTAAGLMNPSVVTVPAGSSGEAILAALRSAAPGLDTLLTVYVVDGDRLVGAIPPRLILAGAFDPIEVVSFAPETPVAAVVEHFALNDDLAVPVIDGDGRLLGAVAVDDILEEVLAERLPGGRRYRGVRRRRRR